MALPQVSLPIAFAGPTAISDQLHIAFFCTYHILLHTTFFTYDTLSAHAVLE
jgi:hypothetical protein